jgi:hypothetical protein
MIDKTLSQKVLSEEKVEKAKAKSKTEEQLGKKVKHVEILEILERLERLEGHVCNLHERHPPRQYEVKIACDEES